MAASVNSLSFSDSTQGTQFCLAVSVSLKTYIASFPLTLTLRDHDALCLALLNCSSSLLRFIHRFGPTPREGHILRVPQLLLSYVRQRFYGLSAEDDTLSSSD